MFRLTKISTAEGGKTKNQQMKKKFQISIPAPCHENWDQMNPVEKGRFCNACQKTVVDFTGMSDAQLVAFFKKPSTGSLCGRFMNDQLEREIALPRKRIPWMKYFFQFSIPVFLASLKMQAQGKVMLKEQTEANCSQGDTVRFIPYVNFIQKEINYKISGKVMDTKGGGIPYASVIVKGTNTGTVSDDNGLFSLNYKSDKEFATLISSSIGFESLEKIIFFKLNESVDFVLDYTPAFNDEVVVKSEISSRIGRFVAGGLFVKEMSFAQKISEWIGFKKDTASIFPNPVQRSQPVTIKFSSMNDQQLRVMMMTLDGKQLDERSFTATKGTNRFQLNIDPKITTGIYIVAIRNEKGIWIKKEKIVVQ